MMRRRKFLVFFGIFAALIVLGYVLRNTIATKAAAVFLERKSPELHCTHPEVSLASTLARISFGEVECTMAEGPVRYAHVQGTSEIELRLRKPVQLHIHKVNVDMRDRDVSNVKADTMSELAGITGLMETLYKGMIDFSELYSPDAPPVLIDELTMTRAGKREALLHGFKKSSDGAWDRCQAATVKATGVAKLFELRKLDLHVMPDRGTLKLSILTSKPERGEVPDMAVAIRASALDAKRPQFSLHM